MESRMSEDTEGIEKEIESELSRISVSSFGADEPDTEGSEGSVSDTESISDDLPESVLSYLSFIKSRNQDAEKVILQDLEDEEPTDNIREVVPCCASDNLAELTSEYNEDSEQFKKRVLFEMENEDLQVATTPSCNNQSSSEIVTNDLFLTADDEMNISLTYNEVEEKCRQEFEQWEKRQSEIEDDKRRKWKAEREAQEKQNEEEHARRVQHLEKFEAERMELELLHKKQQTVMEDELQREKKAWRDKMMQREELIKKLQLRMEQEKRAFEEQKAKESKRLAEQWNTAAVKIQARFRAYLVRKEYAPILKQWKDEIKKKKKIQEEIERELKEREEKMRRRMEERKQNKEEEKKRQEELERQKYLEKIWRQKEYEKKKESLRLEREKELQIREQRKLREKIAKAMITENENNKENIKEDKLTETVNAIRDEKKELCKEQVKEQNEEQIEMISKTNSGMISTERKLTPTLNVLISEKEDSSQVNDENIYINLVTCAEENYSQSKEVDKASGIHALKDESVDFGAYHMVENKSDDTCISQSNVQSNATNTDDQDQFSQSETIKKTVFLMRDANEEVIKDWDTFQEVSECSSRLILPSDIEKKRIKWMSTCKSWSKIYEENQRKIPNTKRRSRKTSVSKMPPLNIHKIIHSGPWSTLQQVTTLTLEDLPACSLSTLSECTNLQVLTVRRCGLVALEGLSSCKDLKYINVEENKIQIIDCENLENLCILILNKNHLLSICGLDGCINLQNLELSYNRITRIGGLESLKNLQRLTVDHNQLISTKGLCEVPTLIYLDCSFNHLTQVEGIESCGLLQILKLQGNNLQELPRLEDHVLLRELYLDDNSISAVSMLSLYWLPLLQILLLSQNSLTELVPFNSFVSLEKLDVKNNCLSDLRSVITCLSGCSNLRELSLSGNPLLQERNWRPSVCKVLPRLQFIDGENVHYHTLPTLERIEVSESRTFLELCQVQIGENVLLKKKVVEEGIASSIDAVQRQCWYFNQLMKLSIEHRCAHEYGELSTTDRDRPEALQNHLQQTSTDCLQENNLFIMGVTENKQVLLDPSERWITTDHFQATFINSSISVHQKENKKDHRMEQKSTESCINYSGESSGNKDIPAQLTLQHPVIESNMGRDHQCFKNNTESRLHMAASVIQSHWRKYHTRRKTDCTKTRNDHLREASREKHEAATVIQASWKGFLLRRKLASALAAVKSNAVDDNYEEINVDDFVSHEAALENEWLSLDATHFHSKTALISNQLHWTKCARPSNSSEHSDNLQLSPQAPWQCLERLHSYSTESTRYHRSSEKGTMSQNSDLKEKNKFSFRSEKEEKISEEWGFKNISTAQLMLKRAHKMKPRKYSNKNLDPAVRLALFKNNENKHLHVKPPKIQSVNDGYFEGEKEEFPHLDTTLDEKLQRNDFMYELLHTQHSDYETASSKYMKSCCFLPDLNHVICNSGQVQLVASPVSREDTELDLVSLASGSALTVNREKNKQPHRHSARSSKKNVSTPEKSHLGPSCRERISFRDHPLQYSGGWGTGKKRQNVKNIS